MPINKAAKFRFDIIDECLRNTKKKWSKTELLRYINRRLSLHFGEQTSISLSQLRYDLAHMQTEIGAPIEMYREGKNYYYRYDEPDFSIKNIPIDEQDLATLKDAIQLLRHIKGFSFAEEMSEMVSRLESKYNINANDAARIISFGGPDGSDDTGYLQDTYEAIKRKTVLKLTYKSFNATTASVWHVHPYLLKAYHNRWYLLGHCTEKGNIGIYALERIEDIKVANIPFIENNEEGDMFKDIIGVTFLQNKNKENIELLFSDKFAPYIQDETAAFLSKDTF